MRKTLFALGAFVLLFSGCLTIPPWTAVGDAALPEPIGPESTYTGFGQPGAHDWTDSDARTLLWLRSNLPNLVSDIPFPIIEFFSYNQHHLTHPYMPFEYSYYFADPDDPVLLVRMLSVTARDRNRTRRDVVLEEQQEDLSAAERPVSTTVSGLSDGEVRERLLVVYP
ncbi:MAG: hypothetical protein C4520_09150 [Candidatus Abyssobacteria bacterium SURF_5]|uniref:DUF4136 domain-containing protein n=1 Tax=Abyssobacteria bacterium (strain SURF_5) TaxID=2093360 RepID=A0A3A4NMG8_ABYX5|nr:MAG: hypothetical protein C4520_09150 [Candidatus Abyssubacteria bacterium SURF_5]